MKTLVHTIVKNLVAETANPPGKELNLIQDKRWIKVWIKQVHDLKSNSNTDPSVENDRNEFCYYLNATERN